MSQPYTKTLIKLRDLLVININHNSILSLSKPIFERINLLYRKSPVRSFAQVPFEKFKEIINEKKGKGNKELRKKYLKE